MRPALSLWLFLITAPSLLLAKLPDYLIKFKSQDVALQHSLLQRFGGSLTPISRPGNLFRWQAPPQSTALPPLARDLGAEFIQPNYRVFLPPNPSIVRQRKLIWQNWCFHPPLASSLPFVKPEIQSPTNYTAGADPLSDQLFPMLKIGAKQAWGRTEEGFGIIVAIADTGIDYNHQDLMANLWHNPGEIADNQIDDDENGYIDDVIGWDFVTNDNKPYDITEDVEQVLFQDGNAGHGTHIAGIVAAAHNNSLGISGVAPQVQLMSLRFIDQTGNSTSAQAVKAIDYAVAMKARIINASWGSDAPNNADPAIEEAVQRALKAGVLFVAAAGNGRIDNSTGKSVGYNNDSDPKPAYPASYSLENIISVGAVDNGDNWASFSNYGKKSVQLAAPGVKILSTVPGNQYSDTVAHFGSVDVTWDGTSMATPFVVGALAVVWSQNLEASWQDVRQSLFDHVQVLPALSDRVSTAGRVDLHWLTASSQKK